MIRRSLLSLALCLGAALVAGPALAQDAPASEASAGVLVELETTAGAILVQTDPRAPITSANFLRYVEEGRLDGTSFYRALQLTPNAGLIQGGPSGVADRILPPIAHEPTSQTGLSHTDGALSMARFEPGTATGDFFIIVGDVISLDAGKASPGDPGFAVFGRVIQGMDVVRLILGSPRSATEGEGVMLGQMLEPRIRIVAARRVEATTR